ncbi:beta-Ala-His dipeptidase [Pseudovirgaria hyperparasitica]|uniref:Beta-Ala-His dipeptidase n=1 Tax=Pseudovirgaria hyperparasitica TaxID=470096 RepID=A0A6A6WGH4_9PEZI|nr:beta-Ala-His dipeptidase [Pseudovirgaria hyperparasitica]KAF2760251.1 beta-Ala-His dipeptidase [Pseudovirgaria hyperparasitica]
MSSSDPALLVLTDSQDIDEQHGARVEVANGLASPSLHSNGDNRYKPSLFHRMRHDKSVLCMAVSKDRIYAGAHRGEILVYRLDTFEREAVLVGHSSSVLGLALSSDYTLLFSSSGDRTVNVWDTSTLTLLYSIYSTYDTGDVFCVTYSADLQVVYLGAQNTSIQWYDLKEKESRPRPKPSAHPSFRQDRFFDSSGPGGVRTPRQCSSERPRDTKGSLSLEIDKHYIRQYAHFGYVYCMLLAAGSIFGYRGEEVLISGGGDGAIKLWRLDADNSGALRSLGQLDDGREEGHSVLTIALDGMFLYSGRLGGEINVWDLETRQLVRNLKTTIGDVLTLTIGGGYLFSAGMDGVVEKFNSQYEPVAHFKSHAGLVLSSAFTIHKGKAMYVTGGNDSTVSVWDVSDCHRTQATGLRTTNEQLFDSLRAFVSYRTVSSDARYKGDCRRGASWLRALFRNFGAATHMLNADDGYNPIILAKFRGNAATAAQRKKILFYGHYDVIAAENEKGKWLMDPFSLEGIDGHLYGRGVSDNKGPIMAAIYAVAELVSEKALEADIVFLIEGEEECGSRGFSKTIQDNKSLVGDIDWILLANSYWLDDHVPCLTYGLRGVIHASVQIESNHPDLHSGVDGSSRLDEPLKDLVLLLSKLTGEKGSVLIPGFYDPIMAVTRDERALYDEITKVLLERNPDLGDSEELADSLMRRWRDPSLTFHGFKTSGPNNSTIIPHLARSALSLRLVPNQESHVIVKSLIEYLHKEFSKLETKNTLTITIDHQAEPWLGDVHNAIFKTLEAAIMEVWGPIYGRRRSSLVTRPAAPSSLTSPPSRPVTSTGPTTSNTLAHGSVTPPDSPVILSPTGTSAQAPMRARKPLYIREGGSIPTIRFLEKEFGAPAAHLPIGQASDSAHLDNERLRLLNLYKGRDIFKKVFRDLPRK